jgi:hypothetical protein
MTSKGSGTRSFLLRGEARVLTWNELTDEQKEAGTQVHALLAQMVASEEKLGESEHFLPRIDQERNNHVLLIDGGRGSGKTALLVTLIDLWKRSWKGDPTIPDDLRRWTEPQGRIVPVGVLDLHPLPESTNLLLHVVSRCARMVEWLEGSTSQSQGSVPWDFAVADEIDARKRWRDLVRAAAGWDGGAEQRLHKLDLEAYIIELEETERGRLDLQSTFHRFVEALKRGYKGKLGGSPPLFVVAVDDADMNPRRSVELLDMLRMLWHPRVAFLLTGHSELFLQTLAEHLLGELRRPLRGHVLHERSVADISEGRQARGLADEIYEKVIPPGHRCVLRPLGPEPRLKVEVQRVKHDGKKDPEIETVRSALRRLRVRPADDDSPSLADYFERDPQLGKALPDRLRGLIDLADEARALLGHDQRRPYAPASHVVAKVWRDALRFHPVQDYDDAVRVDETTGALEVEMPAKSPPRLVPRDVSAATAVTPSSRQARAGASPRPIVHLHRLARYDAVLPDGQRLPSEMSAALTLAAMAAADQTGGRLVSASSGLTGFEPIFASADYLRGAVVRRFAWPCPKDLPFLDVLILIQYWRDALAQRRVFTAEDFDDEKVDLFGRIFLELIVRVVRGMPAPQRRKTWSWKKIAVELVELAELRSYHSGREIAGKVWALGRAGLLAAPESGLSPDGANAFVEALRGAVRGQRGDERWRDFQDALKRERAARVEDVLQKPGATPYEINAVVEDIDRALPADAWAIEVHKPIEREPPVVELKRALVEANVFRPMTKAKTEMLGEAPDAVIAALIKVVENYRNIKNAGPKIMKALWEDATKRLGEDRLSDLVDLDASGHTLTVRALDVSHTFEQEYVIAGEAPVALRVDVGDALAYHVRVSGETRMSRPLEALYRLISDEAADAPPFSGSQRWWPFCRVSTTYAARATSWPSPAWLSFHDAEEMGLRWDRLTKLVRQIKAGGLTAQEKVDALAFGFFNYCSQVALQDELDRTSVYLAAKRDWIERIRVYRERGKGAHDRFKEWYKRAALLAAPESGLSHDAASGILQGFSEIELLDASHLRPLRVEQLGRLAPPGAPDGDAAVRAVDEKAKAVSHPWMDRFGG